MKDSKLVDKTKGTASMLKSTLKRMSRLSLRTTGGSVGSSPRSLSPFTFKKSSSPTQHINTYNPSNSSIPTFSSGKDRKSLSSNISDAEGKKRQTANFYSLNRQNSRKRSGIGAAHIINGVVNDTGTRVISKKSTEVQGPLAGVSGNTRSLSRSTSNSSSSSNINSICSHSNVNNQRSNSLKRPTRNKDLITNPNISNANANNSTHNINSERTKVNPNTSFLRAFDCEIQPVVTMEL